MFIVLACRRTLDGDMRSILYAHIPPDILLREEDDSQRGCLNCLCSGGLPDIVLFTACSGGLPDIALYTACSGGLPDIALFTARYNIKIKQHRKHKIYEAVLDSTRIIITRN